VGQGFDGIITVAPFGCLPGQIIKATMEPYCQTKRTPFLALENDGNQYPPSVITRLEIFAMNVLRKAAKRHARDVSLPNVPAQPPSTTAPLGELTESPSES
jgi:predicted nucleotide-binding protein (sugar kinase/HSP70/actin superfamily)